MFDLTWDQLVLAITGVTAAWLSQDRREAHRKWSSVAGLISQPFWFWSAWKAQQGGIFLLCFVYTACWLRGFYYSWMYPVLLAHPTNED